MKTIYLFTIVFIVINVACSQFSLTTALVKRGQSPIKDDNGAEIDLNVPVQNEEFSLFQDKEQHKSSNQENRLPNKQREYIPRTYSARTIKKKYSEKNGAIRSRKFRERRRKDPIKYQQYLLDERMRTKMRSKKPKLHHHSQLISLERKKELNEQQTLQLAEYRAKARASRKRYRDKQKSLKLKLGNTDREN